MTTTFDFSYFPTLETERLILRRITPKDVADVFAIRADYQATKLNIGAPYTTVEQAGSLIHRMQDNFMEGSELRWGVTQRGSDRVIGMIGFNYWVQADRRAAVGFDLNRQYWGQGIMSDALVAVVRFGFESMGLNRIEADCSIMNVASQRVLEKAGFRIEGRQREHYYLDGMYYDLLLWGLLRSDMQ